VLLILAMWRGFALYVSRRGYRPPDHRRANADGSRQHHGRQYLTILMQVIFQHSGRRPLGAFLTLAIVIGEFTIASR